MKKIVLETVCKSMLADVYTPVGIYLRLRDWFRDTLLLESTDHHAAENSYSFICVNAIGGMEISGLQQLELKYPGRNPEKQPIPEPSVVPQLLWNYMQQFEPVSSKDPAARFAQGLYGYSSYDAVQFFDSIQLATTVKTGKDQTQPIPLMRYRLYQYVIAFNHFKDELIICENKLASLESEAGLIESLIRRKDVPVYPFKVQGEETSNMSDDVYRKMVSKGMESCRRGDVFQIVLSRRFQQGFSGDEFNVYRTLRSVNPSPYLFFFDYGDYKLMGSSPEAQLLLQNGRAIVHPIAGTFKRTGDPQIDKQETQRLLEDAKENAEHVMLVDLARNDLSRFCDEVHVSQFRQVHYYSHVIHLVSEVVGTLRKDYNPFSLLAATFPAGTLSGAPKFKAMEIIDSLEPTAREYYGGALGFMGFDGSCTHAIMIRTFLSRGNTLTYQAGAGVVVASKPESELQEVNNKLGALKKAIQLAEQVV